MYRLDQIRLQTLLSTTKPEDNPPTSNAAHFHICRAFYQASRWQNANLTTHKDLASPVEYGGFRDVEGAITPIMMSNDAMPDVVLEVTTCNCKGDCNTKRCQCLKASLKCTMLCHKSIRFSHDKCRNKINWLGTFVSPVLINLFNCLVPFEMCFISEM